jgi:hypothetical protein
MNPIESSVFTGLSAHKTKLSSISVVHIGSRKATDSDIVFRNQLIAITGDSLKGAEEMFYLACDTESIELAKKLMASCIFDATSGNGMHKMYSRVLQKACTLGTISSKVIQFVGQALCSDGYPISPIAELKRVFKTSRDIEVLSCIIESFSSLYSKRELTQELYEACHLTHEKEYVKWLLSSSARIEWPDERYSPFRAACVQGDIEFASWLLNDAHSVYGFHLDTFNIYDMIQVAKEKSTPAFVNWLEDKLINNECV